MARRSRAADRKQRPSRQEAAETKRPPRPRGQEAAEALSSIVPYDRVSRIEGPSCSSARSLRMRKSDDVHPRIPIIIADDRHDS